MAGNPFDQFDAGLAAAAGNPFDQFDAPKAAAPAEPSLAHKAADVLVGQNPIVGAVEKLGQGVTGLVSKIGGGYAGLGRLVTGGGLDKAADTVRSVQEQGTYQPRSAAAGIIDRGMQAVEKPFDAAAAPIDKAVANSNSPLVQTVAPAAAEAASDIAGLVLPGKGIAKGAEAAAEPSMVEGAAKPTLGTGKTAVETGRAAGYKFTPGGVESRMPAEAQAGEVPQSFAVSPNDRRAINLHNQAKTTQLGGQEIGVPDATTLSPKNFEDSRAPHGKVYDETGAKVGTFKPTPALAEDLSGLEDDQNLDPKVRKDIKRLQLQAASDSMDGPTLVKNIGYLRGAGARDVADALEGELGRQLTASGNAQQMEKFQAARTGFAKSYDLQNATRGGQVDAGKLAALDAKYPNLLTGNLKVIAQSAAASPQDFRLPSGVQPGSSPVSKPTIAGAAKAVLGAGAKLVAPGRFKVTSDAFQNRFGREATPTEQSYMRDFGARVKPPGQPFTLQAPPGQAAGAPAQRGMALPEGPPAAPPLDLQAPEGAIGEGPSRQLGMEIAQGRPLSEQQLGLASGPAGLEPHQPSLLGHPGTPEGGGRQKKRKAEHRDEK